MREKILIFGATGSGKTTLAQELSHITGLPAYTTDKMVYRKIGGKKYSEKQREKNLQKVLHKKRWIIEGVHGADWIAPAVKRAEIVILLDIKKPVLYKRVIKRYLWNKKDRYNSLKTLLKMLYWAHIYKRNSYIEHIGHIKRYKKKYILLKSRKEVKDLLEKVRAKSL